MKGQPTKGVFKKFRMPTSQNLIPIRIDIEVDEQRLKDSFTMNPYDTDPDIVKNIAKATAKDLGLHGSSYEKAISVPIQSQIDAFRAYQGQDMYISERIVPIKLDLRVNHTVVRDQFLWDLNNFESDPEEFAKTLCADLDIHDPEVGPAISFAIRQQLYEIAVQSVASARESRLSKKGRRAVEYAPVSKVTGPGLDLVKSFGQKSSVIRAKYNRKRKDWDMYEPIVDILSSEEVDALEAKEERNAAR